jgi:small subunit ribosomal protein S2
VPQITMKEMLDAGVHFGHQTQRWNPKMKPFVFTSRGGIHIIDLQQTAELTKKAIDFVTKVASEGGKMIFVGTKKQAVEPIQEAAKKCGQFYVTKRWLGGTLTNFVTIKQSIDRMKRIEQMREKGELEFFTKKERIQIEKEYVKLHDYLEGIKEMKQAPQLMFVVDVIKEHIAVAEAKRLGIPVVGICDTNSDPEIIDYPIPGNDDAIRSIKIFANILAEAYNEGAKKWEEVLRSRADKEEVQKVEEEKPAKKAAKKEAVEPAGGPSVVKVTKAARKLVAAGTAEDVEILAEVEAEVEPGDEAEVEVASESTDNE